MFLIDEPHKRHYILEFKVQSINVPKNKKVGPNTTHVNFEIEKNFDLYIFCSTQTENCFRRSNRDTVIFSFRPVLFK